MNSVTNIIRKMIEKDADITDVTFETPGRVCFNFYWYNKDGNPKHTEWKLVGVTNIEISSQPKKHYLEIKEHEIVKNDNLYNLNLILEADTKISVAFAETKATVT